MFLVFQFNCFCFKVDCMFVIMQGNMTNVKILYFYLLCCFFMLNTYFYVWYRWTDLLTCQRKFILVFGFDAIPLINVPFSVIQLSKKDKPKSFLFNKKEMLELNDESVRNSSTLILKSKSKLIWHLTFLWPICQLCIINKQNSECSLMCLAVLPCVLCWSQLHCLNVI